MDSILIEEAPVVPLYYDEVIRFTQKNIRGLGINPIDLLDLRSVQKVNKWGLEFIFYTKIKRYDVGWKILFPCKRF